MNNFMHSAEYDRALQAVDINMWGRARKLFERAAAAGDLRANMKLALMHLNGLGGLTLDLVAATRAMEFCAQQRFPEANYWLAMLAAADPAIEPHASFYEHFAAAVSMDYLPALRAIGVCGNAVWALQRAQQLGDEFSAELLQFCEPANVDAGAEDASRERINAALRQCVRATPPGDRSASEKILVVDGVLSKLEAAYLRRYSQSSLRPALVQDPRTGQSFRSPLRTNSSTVMTPERTDLAIRLIERKIASVANRALLHAEPLGILHYAVGEEYKPHRDYLHDPSQIGPGTPGQRLSTAFCYLNDVPLGGETEFLHWARRVTPQCGRIVLFDNCLEDGTPIPDSVHASLPVLAGEKWLATLWFRQRQARPW
jgi:prolyl 4-hydroxylase